MSSLEGGATLLEVRCYEERPPHRRGLFCMSLFLFLSPCHVVTESREPLVEDGQMEPADPAF